MQAVIFSEQALALTEALWSDAVAHLARRLGRLKPLDAASVPSDRRAALAALADWARDDVSTWEAELGRFYEDHIPIYVRPDPALNATLRRLEREGLRLASWSPGPAPCAQVVVHFLGLGRRFERTLVERTPAAPVRLAEELGLDAGDVLAVTGDADELDAARGAGLRSAAALWAQGADKPRLLAALPTYLAGAPADLVPLALEGRQPVTR